MTKLLGQQVKKTTDEKASASLLESKVDLARQAGKVSVASTKVGLGAKYDSEMRYLTSLLDAKTKMSAKQSKEIDYLISLMQNNFPKKEVAPSGPGGDKQREEQLQKEVDTLTQKLAAAIAKAA